MRNLLLIALILISKNISALNEQLLTKVNQLYTKNATSQLIELSQKYPNEQLISYLAAKASLNNGDAALAQSFINKHHDNFMNLDLIRQMLVFNFNHQNFRHYIQNFENLPESSITNNYRCGYDLSRYELNNKHAITSNIEELLRNKLPEYCIDLIATTLNNKTLDQKFTKPFLFNLIINNQIDKFNQLSGAFELNKLSNNPSSTNSYSLVYQIQQQIAKDPELAFTKFKTNLNKLDMIGRGYLANSLAMNLAIKHLFELANQAIELGNTQYLSDDMYEWRGRTYLALNLPEKGIDLFNHMPSNLQKQASWLYWQSYWTDATGESTLANQYLQQISVNFSYYSLLAQNKLNIKPNFNIKPHSGNLSQIKMAKNARLVFDLYTLNKKVNSRTLANIANQELYYLINRSSDNDLAVISQAAFKINWNDMAIYAALKMQNPIAKLGFPVLFNSPFAKYAKEQNLPISYLLSIAHQESRFVRDVVAFDGGVGLMQIMPQTAAYIAKKMSSPNCYKQYECNIKFGAWYLRHLYDKFAGNILYSSASYNAGPGRGHRWQNNLQGLDNRIQIELIPFKITRGYVQNIMRNKLIYDHLLKINSADNLSQVLSKIDNKKTTYIIDDEDLWTPK